MGIAAITTWSTNQVLTSTALNTNFSTIRDHYNANAVETSGAQTIAGVKTFSAIPVFSLGATVSAGGITVTGNSTITGTLGGLTGLTVASGGAAITGNSEVTGTLNVTSTLSQGGTAIPTGSGTNGKLTRWTGASTIGDGGISDDGTFATLATQPRTMLTATQNVTTTAAIDWDTEVLDVGGMWAIGNPSRIVIPASAGGSYTFSVSGVCANSADATVTLALRRDGSTNIGQVFTWGLYGATLSAADTDSFSFSWIVDATAGQYYEVTMSTSSSTLTVDVQATARKVW